LGCAVDPEASTKRAGGLHGRQDLKHYLSLEEVAEDPGVRRSVHRIAARDRGRGRGSQGVGEAARSLLPPADSATAILSFDTTHHIGDMMNWTQI
jgi:hypothetical protein